MNRNQTISELAVLSFLAFVSAGLLAMGRYTYISNQTNTILLIGCRPDGKQAPSTNKQPQQMPRNKDDGNTCSHQGMAAMAAINARRRKLVMNRQPKSGCMISCS
jgi:hypothetical protein